MMCAKLRTDAHEDKEKGMNRMDIYDTFHSEVSGATTTQLRALYELTHDGSFLREAGVEFVAAVETAADERGISEGS